MADAPKRTHDPPTGQTPGRKEPKRRSTTSGRFLKRSLFSSAEKEKEEKDEKVSSVIILCQTVKCITCIGILK